MTTRAKRRPFTLAHELKAKADEALAWKRKRHPKAPMDLQGFAYYYAGLVAATGNPGLYEQPKALEVFRLQGLAIWWRTLAHVEAYRAHLRAYNARGRSFKAAGLAQ